MSLTLTAQRYNVRNGLVRPSAHCQPPALATWRPAARKPVTGHLRMGFIPILQGQFHYIWYIPYIYIYIYIYMCVCMCMCMYMYMYLYI